MTPEAQRRLDIAFWLCCGAALVGLVLVALGLTGIGATMSRATAKHGADPSTGAYVGVGIAIVLAFELAEAVLFVAFGRLARRGVRWARIGVVVLTVLALLGFTEGGYVLGLLRLACAAAASVLLLTRPSRSAFSR